MEAQELLWQRGPGDARTRSYYRERRQSEINRQRGREAKRILERMADRD